MIKHIWLLLFFCVSIILYASEGPGHFFPACRDDFFMTHISPSGNFACRVVGHDPWGRGDYMQVYTFAYNEYGIPYWHPQSCFFLPVGHALVWRGDSLWGYTGD